MIRLDEAIICFAICSAINIIISTTKITHLAFPVHRASHFFLLKIIGLYDKQ